MGRSVTTRDVRIVRCLQHAMESEGCIPRLDVDVDVENGVIEVLGVIPDKREHDALLALVQSATGSRRIVDHLIVSDPFGSKLKRRHSA